MRNGFVCFLINSTAKNSLIDLEYFYVYLTFSKRPMWQSKSQTRTNFSAKKSFTATNREGHMMDTKIEAVKSGSLSLGSAR